MENTENKEALAQAQNADKVVVKTKSAILVILMYVFSGGFLGWIGVDRFYKGDVKLGFIKLFMGVIGAILGFVFGFAAMFAGEESGFGVFAIALAGAYTLWVVIDFFLVPISIMINNSKAERG